MGSANINPINVLSKNLREFGSHEYLIDGLNLYKKGEAGVEADYKYLDNNFEITKESVQHDSIINKKFLGLFLLSASFVIVSNTGLIST
ncbi:MAG: hypothetical protein HC905_11400 [Bacteroidales bacterium]|nr:hypothetical protein [Bacteroidales bacterium]